VKSRPSGRPIPRPRIARRSYFTPHIRGDIDADEYGERWSARDRVALAMYLGDGGEACRDMHRVREVKAAARFARWLASLPEAG
jgi:hypothetical protein